jgi:hypothetical protein
MLQAVQTSETSVDSHQSTRRYNPEDGHLGTHRRENLKCYINYVNDSCNLDNAAVCPSGPWPYSSSCLKTTTASSDMATGRTHQDGDWGGGGGVGVRLRRILRISFGGRRWETDGAGPKWHLMASFCTRDDQFKVEFNSSL